MSIQTVAKGITRLDLPDRSGYVVRISREGKRVSKYYSDSKHGGKRKALVTAKAAYAKLLAELGPPMTSTYGKLTSRNSSGVVGVHVAYTQDNRYPGCEYYAYCASWVSDEGKREKASFSWNKYGQDQALELAILARDRQITDRDKVVAIYEKSAAAKKSPRKGKTGKKSIKKAVKKAVKSSVRKTVKKKSVKPAAKKAAKKSLKRSAKKTAKKKLVKKKTAKKKTAKRR